MNLPSFFYYLFNFMTILFSKVKLVYNYNLTDITY